MPKYSSWGVIDLISEMMSEFYGFRPTAEQALKMIEAIECKWDE